MPYRRLTDTDTKLIKTAAEVNPLLYCAAFVLVKEKRQAYHTNVKVIIMVIRLVSRRAVKTFKKRWSRANMDFLVCPKFRLHLSVFQLDAK